MISRKEGKEKERKGVGGVGKGKVARAEVKKVDPWIGQRLGSVARLNRNTHALIMRIS